MSLFKNLFGKKSKPANPYEAFWKWFTQHSSTFFTVVKQQKNIEADFFDKLTPKLKLTGHEFWFVTGMHNDTTAELILTADGEIKDFVFVEELVSAAPAIQNWKITALKPSLNIKDVTINMAGYTFSRDNLHFYANEHNDYADEIDITIVHNDYTEDSAKAITNGVFIFLDNYLGELNFATAIDNMTVTGKNEAEKELIPIEKLKEFLLWREKEFIEKYEGTKGNTNDNQYSMFEATTKDNKPAIAIINTELLKWDSKASHPWIVEITIKYDGSGNNGLPDNNTYNLINKVEDDILLHLKDADGYLNIGRETANNERQVYFACKEFRKPSKVLYYVMKQYAGTLEVDYTIYIIRISTGNPSTGIQQVRLHFA